MEKNIKYIIWQNKSFRFYLASRSLYFDEIYSPSSFCAFQSMELLLKATMFYFVDGFNPLRARHNIKTMIEELNKISIITEAHLVTPWLLNEKTYYHSTRYVTEKKTIPIYESFLDDLDNAYYNILTLVPYQFNSILLNTIKEKKSKSYLILRRKNRNIKRIKQFFVSLRLLPT